MSDFSMDAVHPGTLLRHKSLGECEFVRTEGDNFVVRHVESQVHWRFEKAGSSQHFVTAARTRRAAPGAEPVPPPSSVARRNGKLRLYHASLGECVLVRTQGLDWIIRPLGSQLHYRCSPQARRFLTQIRESEIAAPFAGSPARSPEPDGVTCQKSLADSNRATLTTNATPNVATPEQSLAGTRGPEDVCRVDVHDEVPLASDRAQRRRLLKRAFESLRNGLPPSGSLLEQFAIGMQQTVPRLDRMLESVHLDGGNAAVIRGGYGQGKTFSLKLLEHRALTAGFLVASTEIDAYENKIEKPHHIYRALMSNLCIPGSERGGIQELTALAVESLRAKFPGWHRSGRPSVAEQVRQHLSQELQCEPLAWLLSDPSISENQSLMGLLACEPGLRVGEARKSHLLRAQPRIWPAFTAGTQGDFASYVLSGLGRLARLLDFRGFLILLDEMEKWQSLDWKAQCRAGNLFGGLVWGATAELGCRSCVHQALNGYRGRLTCQHDNLLAHSHRCGGYPFTTPDRCFLGVAVAMTPRGDDGPEAAWDHYGVLEILDLPPFTITALKDYFRGLVPLYQQTFSLSEPVPNDLFAKVIRRWQSIGDESARSATRAVVETLDDWRSQMALPV
jgi:hypothetical protein